jgi:hypothetical protein
MNFNVIILFLHVYSNIMVLVSQMYSVRMSEALFGSHIVIVPVSYFRMKSKCLIVLLLHQVFHIAIRVYVTIIVLNM